MNIRKKDAYHTIEGNVEYWEDGYDNHGFSYSKPCYSRYSPVTKTTTIFPVSSWEEVTVKKEAT